MVQSTVLDTNVISELFAERPNQAVSDWYVAQASESLYTTSITLAELLYGIELLPLGKRRDRLSRLVTDFFEYDLTGKVLIFDQTAALEYAVVRARKKCAGLAMQMQDAQIAAIALTNGASVATRNITDFQHCGLELIDPWLA